MHDQRQSQKGGSCKYVQRGESKLNIFTTPLKQQNHARFHDLFNCYFLLVINKPELRNTQLHTLQAKDIDSLQSYIVTKKQAPIACKCSACGVRTRPRAVMKWRCVALESGRNRNHSVDIHCNLSDGAASQGTYRPKEIFIIFVLYHPTSGCIVFII